MAFENNFFAAEPNHPILLEWLETLMTNLQRPYEETSKELIACGLDEYRWTSSTDVYLIAMESLKLAIARKNKELHLKQPGKWRHVIEAEQVWGFSGYLGAQKSRNEFKIERPPKNTNVQMVRYPWEYS